MQDIFKVLKGKKSTTKITVPGKDLTENWWRNKKLFRQAKVNRIQYHQNSFTTNVKGTYIVKKYKKKDLQNQPQTIKNMAIGTYILIITLNVNGLNVPTKRHKQAATAAAAAKSLQSCMTLCDPIDGSPPGSPVPGILQARPLEWLPFPSPMHENEKWKWSRLVVSDS